MIGPVYSVLQIKKLFGDKLAVLKQPQNLWFCFGTATGQTLLKAERSRSCSGEKGGK